MLSNRIYLGELTFRGITATGCHPPVIEQAIFDEAHRILAARGEDHCQASGQRVGLPAHRADPLPRVRQRDARHPRPRQDQDYRYYSCYRRTRYDTDRVRRHGSTPTLSSTR